MATEDEIRQASDQFYTALGSMLNGDAAPMGDIWSQAYGVSTMHPLGGRELGWESVRAAWESAAEAFSGGSVNVTDLEIRTLMLPTPSGSSTSMQASESRRSTPRSASRTSIGASRGSWKVVHHHTDADAAVQEALGLT
jgi:hypothetical protein